MAKKTAHDDEMTEVEDPGEGEFVKFAEPGDGVTGNVIVYSPDTGANDYHGGECGFITLESDGTIYKCELSKPNLIRKIAAARPVRGLRMDIRFHEWQTSKNQRKFKNFKVRIGKRTGLTESAAPQTVAEPIDENSDIPF